jgi:hypothetical protein
METNKRIPVFKTWRGWYIAVLIAQVAGIFIFYLLTNTFHPH